MSDLADVIGTELLPPLLQEFVRLIDVQPTMALVERWGGLRIFIPTPDRVTPDHPIAQVVGVDNLMTLAQVYGGEAHFQLPKAMRAMLAVRNARIVAGYRSKTARELAVEFHLTESQIVRILAAMGAAAPTDRRQPSLF